MDKGHIKRLWMTPLGLRVEYFETEGAEMPQDRDTHFQHAAHFLLQEMDKRRLIADDTSLHYEEMQTLIAQFAYDLACHNAAHISEAAASMRETEIWSVQEVVANIPDLTQWPESPTAE